MLAIVSAPVSAQDDSKAALEQVVSILKSGASDADKQIEKIAKPFKKDSKTLVAIGREYLKQDNTAMAEKYANMATAKDKSCGEAYILLADVAIHNDNGGRARDVPAGYVYG